MSTTPEAFVYPITQVENVSHWFTVDDRERRGSLLVRCVHVLGITERRYTDGTVVVMIPIHSSHESDDVVDILRYFYNLKIGEVGCYWGSSRIDGYRSMKLNDLIEFRYANIKFGDLFDYYTSADGVLRLPNWKHLKHAMDEYLAEDPRLKFHPSRVQQFIDENSVENLELMG